MPELDEATKLETAFDLLKAGRIDDFNKLPRHKGRGHVYTDMGIAHQDLSRIDLRSANFENVFLFRTNFCHAELQGVNFRRAGLSDAQLYDADLSGADFEWGSLHRAGLCRAKLHEAKLKDANLQKADLTGAKLCNANLVGADLRSAIFKDADLTGADLRYAEFRTHYLGWERQDPAETPPDYTGANCSGAIFSSQDDLEYVKSKGGNVDGAMVNAEVARTGAIDPAQIAAQLAAARKAGDRPRS